MVLINVDGKFDANLKIENTKKYSHLRIRLSKDSESLLEDFKKLCDSFDIETSQLYDNYGNK